MKRVLVINVPGPLNRGSMAVTLSLIRNLNARNPNLCITLSTPHFEIDKKLYPNERVTIVGHPFYKETGNLGTTLIFGALLTTIGLARWVLSIIMQRPSIVENAYGKYDAIIDLCVDHLSDYYHKPSDNIIILLNGLFWKLLLKKPIMLVAASGGPLVRRTSRFMARFVLNRYEIITWRDGYSEEYARKLGITKPKMAVTADLSFPLAPVGTNKVDEILRVEDIPLDHKPIIGICPSQFASMHAFPMIKEKRAKYEEFVALIARIAIYVRDRFDVFVLLIPHSVDPKYDDRALSGAVYETIGQQNENIKFLKSEYRAEELKGVIGRCSLLVSFLMHPTIAACSLAVPVVAPSYGRSNRVHGIIGGLMGQENSIVDFENFGFDELFLELTERIDYVWSNRHHIHAELVERSRVAKELSLSNFDFVESLFHETETK